MGISTVSPLRVRSLVLSALGLFSKGDDEGRFWIQEQTKSDTPLLGSRYGYCSIGAINEVPGFTEQEKSAARIALAKMIDRDLYGGTYLQDYCNDPEYGKTYTFDADPYMADDLIVEANDGYETEFENVRSWFINAAAWLKAGGK